MTRQFAGKVVFITGASSGIGRALALEFAREGAALALAARRLDRLRSLEGEIRELGSRALALSCDVSSEDSLHAAVEATLSSLGGIHVAIANAGFGVAGNLQQLTLADYRRQFETNVYGVLRTVYAVLPELIRTRGTLVLIGSVSGHIALPGSSAYAMSKFAVRALAESLRFELGALGVSVVLISPGFIHSDFHKVDNQGVLHPEAPDPISRRLRMPAEKAARQIVKATARRKPEQVITLHGKLAVWVKRHFPWIFTLLVGGGLSGRPQPGRN